jgi:hypothetical protein
MAVVIAGINAFYRLSPVWPIGQLLVGRNAAPAQQRRIRKAKASPDQLEPHIRSAFMDGMVLGADCKQSCPMSRRMRMPGAGWWKRSDAQRFLPGQGVAQAACQS